HPPPNLHSSKTFQEQKFHHQSNHFLLIFIFWQDNKNAYSSFHRYPPTSKGSEFDRGDNGTGVVKR
ncbi:25663_t:CDS:1, partial [Racocetra persica]